MPHDIIPGDWIIRSAPEPDTTAGSGVEDPILRFMMKKMGNEDNDFSFYAVCVMDATLTHLTVFNPVKGRAEIIQLSLYKGDWHLATEKQVEVTWTLAKMNVRSEMIGLLEASIKTFPYRKRSAGASGVGWVYDKLDKTIKRKDGP